MRKMPARAGFFSSKKYTRPVLTQIPRGYIVTSTRHLPRSEEKTMDSLFRLYVSPCGNRAVWAHKLDLTNLQYADWIDATDLDDDEFEELVTGLQRKSAVVH